MTENSHSNAGKRPISACALQRELFEIAKPYNARLAEIFCLAVPKITMTRDDVGEQWVIKQEWPETVEAQSAFLQTQRDAAIATFMDGVFVHPDAD